MNCRKPFISGTAAFPCGQCLPCRINRRRLWSHRLTLEALLHEFNSFVTLTYSEKKLPLCSDGSKRSTLKPVDLTNFLKRLREAHKPLKFRYYAAGEYGDETWRPHYHLALFGYPPCVWGSTRFSGGGKRCCASCEGIERAWGNGRVQVARLDPASASYIAGYVTKKMTRWDDERLEGRHPEFARMSLRPGIGHGLMEAVAKAVEFHKLKNDVVTLRHGKQELPLGRYLVRRLRVLLERPVEAPRDPEREAKMLDLLKASIANEVSLSQQVAASSEGKVASLEARHKIYNRRKAL